MRRAFALGVVAACSTQGRVDIVVSPPAGVDTVALFIGDGDGTSDTIVRPDTKLGPQARWWPRDPGNDSDQLPVMGDDVTFAYQAGAFDRLGAIVAVGFSGGKPVAAAWHDGIAIPSEGIARFPLTLAPVGNALGVTAWQPASGAKDPAGVCIAYEDADDPPAKLIVTDGDPDCDGFASDDPRECLAKVYNGHRTARLDEVDCLSSRSITVPGGSARTIAELGGPRCTDGTGQEQGCFPTRFCIAHNVVEVCGADFACAIDATAHNTVTGMLLRCPLDVDASGNICPGPLQAFGMANPPYVSGRMCVEDVQITNGDGFGQEATFPTAKFKVQDLQPSCDFTIVPEGAFPAQSDRFAALAVANLDNGRGVALPIVFERGVISSDGCSGETRTCVLEASLAPDLIDCINAPAP